MSLLENQQIEQAFALIRKKNKYAKQQNRLLKKQVVQSKLDHQQAERLYLLEKSKIQPTFKLSVSEFLLSRPDFVNDPEHAMEADFLVKSGYSVDQRILRFKLSDNGKGQFLRPALLVNSASQNISEKDKYGDRLLSMTPQIFFASIDSLAFKVDENNIDEHDFNAYLIYRDQTTLPVVLKFRISQLLKSKLMRWEVEHVDTVFVGARNQLKKLRTGVSCEQLFENSYE